MSQTVTETEFRALCGRFATGIAVITVRRPDGRSEGVTVNSFTSVSLDPPLVLFCLDLKAGSYESFDTASTFAVNILSRDQRAISSRFAEIGVPDRFSGIELLPNEMPDGPPLLSDCLGHLVCQTEARYPGGDHTIFIGRVDRVIRGESSDPLLYFGGGYHAL